MEPTSLPDNDQDGWVTDDRALLTVFTLRAVLGGDEVVAERVGDGARGHVAEIHAPNVAWVCDSYGNPGLNNGTWKILAWRRPRG